MSELTWLAELIANHELSVKLKKHIIKRMKQIDMQSHTITRPNQIVNGAAQAASTIALMEKHGPLPAIMAATPQTQAAIQNRQQLIDNALNGKPEKGLTSPIKMRGPLK